MADKPVYGGRSGKQSDEMLDFVGQLVHNRDAALSLVREFALADPTLWPILAEIELALIHVREQ